MAFKRPPYLKKMKVWVWRRRKEFSRAALTGTFNDISCFYVWMLLHVEKLSHSQIQGDHLGMYLKQTPGSNVYWQTQSNIMHRSNTQGGSFYLWRKTIPYLEGLAWRTGSKWHPDLPTGAARLDVGRVWLFSPDQSMLLTKDIYHCI